MNEKEAMEITEGIPKHNALTIAEAKGYLKAIKKAEKLVEAVIHAQEYFQFNKKEIMYTQMKETLSKWEKSK